MKVNPDAKLVGCRAREVCDYSWMRTRLQPVLLPADVGEFADEVRRIFVELGEAGTGQLTGECSPAVDVYETDDALEIAVDLPDVEVRALRIVVKGSAVLIAGEKAPRRGHGDATFHLVERGFGRFARLIRLSTPCETSRGRAALAHGELRISLPKIRDRRGQGIALAVAAAP